MGTANGHATTSVHEIADGIFRLSTLVREIAPPAGFTFNQFLVLGNEPLLFHCGQRALFPSVSAAASRVVPLRRLRWITFGHLEADESGSMDEWLAAAPRAEVAHGAVGVNISLRDLAARPPRIWADGEAIDLGGKRVRHLDTPHVPHAWDARLLYEETTRTLLCGDLFAHVGDGPALVSSDLVGPAMAADELFRQVSLGPLTGATLRRLAALEPRTLALGHGSSFAGDGGAALRALADEYDRQVRAALAEPGAGRDLGILAAPVTG
jgi:flavorubredoxin